MTTLVQNRMIIVAALLLPTAASLWLRSGGLPNVKPSTIVVVGGLWLAATAVITLHALKGIRATGTAGRLTHDEDDHRPLRVWCCRRMS